MKTAFTNWQEDHNELLMGIIQPMIFCSKGQLEANRPLMVAMNNGLVLENTRQANRK